MPIVHFNDLHLYDLKGKEYEIFYPKKNFTEVLIPSSIEFDLIEGGEEILEHRGVVYIINLLLGLAHCNPTFNLDTIKRQFDLMANKTTTSIPNSAKEIILEEVSVIMQEGKVSETVEAIKRNPFTSSHLSLERAYVICPAIKDGERAKVKGQAMSEYTFKKRISELKTVLRNWDLKKYGQPTNRNIAELVKISEEQIKKKYSRFLKEEKRLAKERISGFSSTERKRNPLWYNDVNGKSYHKNYLLNTNKTYYFPWKGEYTITNFGQICKGEKPMSIDRNGLVKISIDGKRPKVKPESVMKEILFIELLEERQKDNIPENIFDTNENQLMKHIKLNSISNNNHNFNNEIILGFPLLKRRKVIYNVTEMKEMEKVWKRKNRFNSNLRVA